MNIEEMEKDEAEKPLQFKNRSTSINDIQPRISQQFIFEKESEEEKEGVNIKIQETDASVNQTATSEPVKKSRLTRKQIIIAAVIGFLIVAAIVTILVIVLRKKVKPSIITNPYQLKYHSSSKFKKIYNMTRDKSLNGEYKSKYAKKETSNNTFIDNAILKVSALSMFNGVRIQIQDSSSNQYQVSDEFLSPDFVKAIEKEPLSIDQIDQSLIVQGEGSNYTLKAFQTVNNNDGQKMEDFFTTQDQEMYLMTHFQQIGFQVKSRKLSGWGTRIMQSLYLENGTYPIYPQKPSQNIDNGTAEMNNQGSGAHPFLMMEITDTGQFAGIFLFNSNPMSLEIQLYNGLNRTLNDWASLTFRTTGGMLDFFIFYGPTYQDVLQQYQEVIGRPKMLPIWASGFFFKSTSLVKAYNQLLTVKKYREFGFPLQGFVLPNDLDNSYFMNMSSLYIAEIRNTYPDERDLQLILPFTYFMNNNSFNQKKYEIKIEGESLYIETKNYEDDASTAIGRCVDVFNNQYQSEYLEWSLFNNEHQQFQGYWLENNLPTIQNFDQRFKQQIDDFPYYPGQTLESKTSLPDLAEHRRYSNDTTIYHFNLHSLYGTKMAKSFIETLSSKYPKENPFVFTDSTFPGIGRIGAAHLFSTQSISYEDLTPTLVSMINHQIFGIGNSGPELCNYREQQVKHNDDICLRYFTLSVISPLAFQINRLGFIQTQNFSQMAELLQIRSQYLLYMRSEMKQIELHGGSLLRPMHTEFSSFVYLLNDIDTVMYGNSIMATFMFHPTAMQKYVYFPTENSWLDLSTTKMREFKGRASENIDFGNSKMKLYQKEGTIVVKQKPNYNAFTHTLQLEPISLSIFQDRKGRAHGYVFIEYGLELESVEYHEIWLDNDIITFHQIESTNFIDDSQQNPQGKFTQINVTAINNYYSPYQPICVLSKDMHTMANIQYSSIQIKDAAFIFNYNFWPQTACKISSLWYKIEQVFRNEDYVFEAQIKYGNDFQNYLYVELLSDNSLYILMSDKRFSNQPNQREVPSQFYDRTFTNIKSKEKTNKLKDVFKAMWNIYQLDNQFCYQIYMPKEPTKLLLNTCNQLRFNVRGSRNVFNFEQQYASKFFGLGERKSEFFLQDKTTYAFYNNDKNSEPTKMKDG